MSIQIRPEPGDQVFIGTTEDAGDGKHEEFIEFWPRYENLSKHTTSLELIIAQGPPVVPLEFPQVDALAAHSNST